MEREYWCAVAVGPGDYAANDIIIFVYEFDEHHCFFGDWIFTTLIFMLFVDT